MRVAVAGGTGMVGQHVVRALRAAGHEPVVVARSHGVDLSTGDGVREAMAEAEGVIDVSNVTTLRRRRAQEFFTAATTHLVAAGQQVGVRHHVVLSIVGVDRVPLGYYRAKEYQERLALVAPVPVTVLRATQFHEFAEQLLARTRGPVVAVPHMRSQPVAAQEVAAHLVRLLEADPVGLAPELAGPEVHDMVDLARRVVQARRRRRRVLGTTLPGTAGRALTDGALLPTGDGPRGTVTFAEWLAQDR